MTSFDRSPIYRKRLKIFKWVLIVLFLLSFSVPVYAAKPVDPVPHDAVIGRDSEIVIPIFPIKPGDDEFNYWATIEIIGGMMGLFFRQLARIAKAMRL